MTIITGGKPTLPGAGTYSSRAGNGPLPLGSLSQGVMSLANEPLKDAHSSMRPSTGQRHKPLEWSLVDKQRPATSDAQPHPNTLSGALISGLFNTNLCNMLKKKQASKFSSSPARLEAKQKSGDSSPSDEEPRRPGRPLSSRRPKQEGTYPMKQIVPEPYKSPPQRRSNSPDEEESNHEKDSSTARQIAQMTRPHAIWDALNWLELRQESLEEGKHEDVRSLMNAAHKSTQHVLQNLSYVSETGSRMSLKAHVRPVKVARWFGRENLDNTELPEEAEWCSTTVPIVVAECEPLEVVRRLKNAGMSREINVLTEITEFDECTGDISRQCKASSAQQSCLLQTDFSDFLNFANRQMTGLATIQDHLRASDDPYVCLCPEVTLFRGTRDDGYPLLDEPFSLNVIFSSLPEARPLVQVCGDGTTWYADEKDQTALLERLNLIGLVALQKEATNSETLPVLVLNAFGCGGRGQHPRDAVANSLKHWRKGYGRYFHCVIVACGSNRDLALHMDRIINEQVYGLLARSANMKAHMKEQGMDFGDVAVQQEMMELGKWHWDSDILALHCRNLELQSLGRKSKGFYEQNEEERQRKRRKSLSVPAQRRSSLGLTDADRMDLENLGAAMEAKANHRVSVKLNGQFFSEALNDTLNQMALSRCASPSGSRAASPDREVSEDGAAFRRRPSMSGGGRQNSISGGSDRQNSISGCGYLESPTVSRSPSCADTDIRKLSVDGNLPEKEIRRTSLMAPGIDSLRKGSMDGRKNSVTNLGLPDDRKNSMEGRKNSTAGFDIVSANFSEGPSPSTERPVSGILKRTGSKELKPEDVMRTQEEIRRQARENLRTRKCSAESGGSGKLSVGDVDLENDAPSKGAYPEPERDENSLMLEVQRLAGKLQTHLTSQENIQTQFQEQQKAAHNKRLQRWREKTGKKVNRDPEIQVKNMNDEGCKKMSIQIPEVPAPIVRKSSLRKIMGV